MHDFTSILTYSYIKKNKIINTSCYKLKLYVMHIQLFFIQTNKRKVHWDSNFIAKSLNFSSKYCWLVRRIVCCCRVSLFLHFIINCINLSWRPYVCIIVICVFIWSVIFLNYTICYYNSDDNSKDTSYNNSEYKCYNHWYDKDCCRMRTLCCRTTSW